MHATLNTEQNNAVRRIKKFLSRDATDFLLLGPAGTGKSTVIANAFDASSNVAFCAFTNKATQVLRSKCDMSFNFLTIHKLLALTPVHLENEFELSYEFNRTKVDHIKDYDVIIFDECSIISKELFKYIREARDYIAEKYDKILKYIFIGDLWQLTPVGETDSSIFEAAIAERWPVAKLSQLMRNTNGELLNINKAILQYIDGIDTNIQTILQRYPYNLIPARAYLPYDRFLQRYLEFADDNSVILTYSKANCEKINFTIQDFVNLKAGRPAEETRVITKFYPNDRCCLERPIESNNQTIHPGEIYTVLTTEDIEIKTDLNKYGPEQFYGQRLTVINIQDHVVREIIHIPADQVMQAKSLLKRNTRRHFYITVVMDFYNRFPILHYGYALTVYKSQGSEWDAVFVYLTSIKWSIVGRGTADDAKKCQLLKATYTAISRAKSKLYCCWT